MGKYAGGEGGEAVWGGESWVERGCVVLERVCMCVQGEKRRRRRLRIGAAGRWQTDMARSM